MNSDKYNGKDSLTPSKLRDTKKFLQAGAVAGTHGLKGEVKVFPMTDDPTRFKKCLKLYMALKRGEVCELSVEHARVNGRFILMKFKGLDSIEAVERFQGCELFVSRDDALELNEGEYFIADIIGLQVFDEEGDKLGEVTDVITAPANDVYEMKLAADGRKVLFPAIKQCVKEIEIENNRMVIHVMDGLW